MGRKNSVGTANGLPNGERAGGAAAGSGAPVPRHLLVMRTSAMGDVAMLPHALRALTAAYPDLRVTVATQAMFRPFFAGLDVGFLDVDVKGAHHSLAGMWRLAAQARRLGVDAVADVHDVLRSKAFRLAMRLHGVPAAHIDKGRAGKRAFIRCGGRGMEPLRHTVLRYCDVFRKLGFVLDDPAPAVRRDRPNPFGEKHGVWVGFAPFSAHRGKTYPEEQSRELVRMLSERYGWVFIHGGGGAEQAFAEEMERTYPNVTALYGKVRFAGEMDLIANLDCVVTMDSLVMHLASLVAGWWPKSPAACRNVPETDKPIESIIRSGMTLRSDRTGTGAESRPPVPVRSFISPYSPLRFRGAVFHFREIAFSVT